MLSRLELGIISETPESTRAVAREIAEAMGFSGCICLTGGLGAGKTVFAKGLAEAMGVAGPVKSPSYNVCLTYEGSRGNFAHIDAYRLGGPEAYEALLIDEIVPEPRLVCVEWPQAVSDALPADALFLEISILEDMGSRMIRKI